jgi:hypothetical protein
LRSAIVTSSRTTSAIRSSRTDSRASLVGSAQIIDSSRSPTDDRFILTASPDGEIHKLATASGREVQRRVAHRDHPRRHQGEDRRR